MIRSVMLLGGLALAGCGGQPPATNQASHDSGSSAGIASAVDCSGKPDFVPVYADAKISTCTQGDVAATGRTSGTILYTSAAAPTTVLSWSKEQALRAGLALKLEDGMSISAMQGDERTLKVMAMAQGAGSTVTVNWGQARR